MKRTRKFIALLSAAALFLATASSVMAETAGQGESQKTPAAVSAEAREMVDEEQMKQSEELAGKVEEALEEKNLDKEVDIEFTSQYVQLTVNGALLFDSGKVELKQESLSMMNQLGIILQRFAEGTIEIEGHTDNVPMSGAKYSNNDELSAGRALSVFYYLRDNTTLDMSRVKHSGRGEYIPIADNSTPEGRAMNRRVEIRIYNALSSYN